MIRYPPGPKLAKARDRLHAAARAKLCAEAEDGLFADKFSTGSPGTRTRSHGDAPTDRAKSGRTNADVQELVDLDDGGGIVLTTGVVGVVLNRSRPQYTVDSSTCRWMINGTHGPHSQENKMPLQQRESRCSSLVMTSVHRAMILCLCC